MLCAVKSEDEKNSRKPQVFEYLTDIIKKPPLALDGSESGLISACRIGRMNVRFQRWLFRKQQETRKP